MKITFITPTPPDISSFGVRSLSAYLKQKGYKTEIIFLPGGIESLSDSGDFSYHYDRKVLGQIADICKGSGLIGISFMTYYFDRGVELTRFIKEEMGIPVIWGGIHPTLRPEEGLEYADMVCVGEGEEMLLQLVQTIERGGSYGNIKGLWFKDNGTIVRNGVCPIIEDLDRLPFFDYDLTGHYIYDIEKKGISPLDMNLLKKTMPLLPYFNNKFYITYRTMTDRGCPHNCTYCNVTELARMYRENKGRYFRARSINNVLEELVTTKKKYPFIQAIQFFDDTFFVRTPTEIKEFSNLYKENISLPFYCQGSPNTITEEKIEYLVDAGMVFVEMGIQSGSQKIKKMYRRTESNERIIETTRLISKYRNRLFPPDYHIIIDNPWETDDDLLETLKLLLKIPKPYGLCIASLSFFPGTELYNKAKGEGLIKDEKKEIYRRPFLLMPAYKYLNLLIYLLSFRRFPKWIIRLLGNEKIVKFVSKRDLRPVYKLTYKLIKALEILFKGLNALFTGDFKRIQRYFHKVR